MKKFTTVYATAAFGFAAPTLADQVISDDLIVQRDLCVGAFDCVDGEVFGSADIKIKSVLPQIWFDDQDLGQADWQIGSIATQEFVVHNQQTAADVLVLHPNAPDNAIYLANSGRLGLGTTLPGEELHIISSSPNVRLETFDFGGYVWDVGGNASNFFIRDVSAGSFPFLIEPGAPQSAIRIADNGNIGLGTGNPQAPLELATDNTFNFFRITAFGAAVNDSVDITFTGGPLGTGQLRYNIVDGDNQEMSLDANGNMVLDGTLTTAGPTCAGGCDRVFDEDYALKSIADHQAQMWAAGYLPQVGPTVPDQPINVTEKMGRMLNELEHAHIYIGQLHDSLGAAQADMDQMRDQLASERARGDDLAQTVALLAERLGALEAQRD